MDVAAFENLLQECGFAGVARGKKLRHASDPPTVYFNWKRSGEVYFTAYRADAESFPDTLWREIPAQQEKDSQDGLITLLPISGSEREAFEDLLTRTAETRKAPNDKAGDIGATGIPAGITREDVLSALADLDAARVDNRFGESRSWDVLERGKLYPPKRVIGIAARRLAGHVLTPADFSGGEESRCHAILEDLGFHIVPKGDTQEIDSTEEQQIDASIRLRTDIPTTIREQLIAARRGQGRFRRAVYAIEKHGCRVTGVRDLSHLRASHIKPWKVSSDDEKLDGCNGLLLSPHVDHLFDRGYLSFDDTGALMISKHLSKGILVAWGVRQPIAMRPLDLKQGHYMDYHRSEVFEKLGRRIRD